MSKKSTIIALCVISGIFIILITIILINRNKVTNSSKETTKYELAEQHTSSSTSTSTDSTSEETKQQVADISKYTNTDILTDLQNSRISTLDKLLSKYDKSKTIIKVEILSPPAELETMYGDMPDYKDKYVNTIVTYDDGSKQNLIAVFDPYHQKTYLRCVTLESLISNADIANGHAQNGHETISTTEQETTTEEITTTEETTEETITESDGVTEQVVEDDEDIVVIDIEPEE